MSTAGVVLGVAGATSDRTAILVAGVAALVAGALSMATGEYVSVSTQRDSERALLRKEARELAEDPDDELEELAGLYVDRGLDDALALEVAKQLTAHDALGAHAEIELGIDPDDLTRSVADVAYSSTAFLFDGSDQMPGEVGAGSFWREMTAWISDQQDLDTTLTNIDESWPS